MAFLSPFLRLQIFNGTCDTLRVSYYLGPCQNLKFLSNANERLWVVMSWRYPRKSPSNFPCDSKLKVNKSLKKANHQMLWAANYFPKRSLIAEIVNIALIEGNTIYGNLIQLKFRTVRQRLQQIPPNHQRQHRHQNQDRP